MVVNSFLKHSTVTPNDFKTSLRLLRVLRSASEKMRQDKQNVIFAMGLNHLLTFFYEKNKRQRQKYVCH